MTSDRIDLGCASGHVWAEMMGEGELQVCTHRGKDVQTDFVCPACAAGLSVVNAAQRTGCPRCGATMRCLRCYAGSEVEHDRKVACPQCGGLPVVVKSAPSVSFRGDVNKTVR